MSSASDQKLFCEVCSALNCSFDEFVGKWSPRPIPPPSWLLKVNFLMANSPFLYMLKPKQQQHRIQLDNMLFRIFIFMFIR